MKPWQFIVLIVALGFNLVRPAQAAPRLTLSYFESVQQAQEWLDGHQQPIVLYAGADGNINLLNASPDSRYDCDDYAERLQDDAAKDGWNIWPAPVTDGMMWHRQVTALTDGYHIGNMTLIGNWYYYIESSPGTDRWYKLVPVLERD